MAEIMVFTNNSG